MTSPVVEVDGLCKSFWVPGEPRHTIREHVLAGFRPVPSRRFDVLSSISFTVRRGEALGIMGANGCGKSTLLKMVCGVYQPDRGSVRLRGDLTPILDLGIGWNPELDAVDNVYLIGSVLGMSLADLTRDLRGILEFAGLQSFARLPLKHFSSGMSARLAYAVAFRAVQEILVLDEVLAVGDAWFKQRCFDRYRQLRAAGHTTLVVSHDPHLIRSFCDRALLLDGGGIVLDGAAGAVADAYLQRMTSAAPAFR